MITLTKTPLIQKNTAEGIKHSEIFACYNDIALFWNQEKTDVSLCLLDGNMTIIGENADFEELKSFVGAVNPDSIFSNKAILEGLAVFEDSQKVSVLKLENESKFEAVSDNLSSKDVYEILSSSGLELPPYQYFATDFCLRLNKGRLNYFGVRNKGVAVAIGDESILIHALASCQKGMGTFCLNALLGKINAKDVFVCTSKEVKPFYLRNGFKEEYTAGYWRKK
ncbi:MAG: hypothetical protein MJ090_00870 [Clostridia bacterium]|nr:hypothetical protein [Clostridia bacterium]